MHAKEQNSFNFKWYNVNPNSKHSQIKEMEGSSVFQNPTMFLPVFPDKVPEHNILINMDPEALMGSQDIFAKNNITLPDLNNESPQNQVISDLFTTDSVITQEELDKYFFDYAVMRYLNFPQMWDISNSASDKQENISDNVCIDLEE